MPALQSFCTQAAIAIIFNFIFQIFTFVVALIYDEERRQKGKADILCCVSSSEAPSQPKNFWKRIFREKYNNLLQKNACQFATIAISVMLLALAIVGSFYVPVGLNEQVSMEVDSDLFHYFTQYKKYIETGPPAYIVFNNFDYEK
jgi:Niemann-Pick C1 protein